MPTMTNPETGETKDISLEELMEIMRTGQGSLQQVVTYADGRTSTTTLYGNVSEDGLDRSVNIFVDKETFNAFILRKINKLAGEIEDPESEKDPGELFEMTVDFTDSALMGILKATENELTINLYTRDERKATFDYLRQGSKSWKINPDHTIEFDGADLQGDDRTVSLYMFAFWEMRQFLRASGNLAELKRLGNRGTGVVIKASDQADDAKATIVRGKNRPDLPCNMFLLGEQMMRPYMDEMMSDMMMSGMSIEDKIREAEDGDPDCMESLAQAYLNGDGVEQDFEKSAFWWKKLAETDNAVAQFNIGLYYAKGCGVKRDFAKAAEWMGKAVDNGDEDAPNAAELYRKADKNLAKAVAGDAEAAAEMALIYMTIAGSLEQAGTGSDYDESLRWAKIAADAGKAAGFYLLGLSYEHGRGVVPDEKKAIMFYQKGADLGHADSMCNYASYILNKKVPGKSRMDGFSLMLRSAKLGYPQAMYNVGRCYQFGDGVEDDMGKAIEWYEKYLEVHPDPELEQKVAVFKMIEKKGFNLTDEDPEQPADDEPMPSYEFDLTHTKTGDRKERSNRIRVGDTVSFRLDAASDRIVARTQIGDVGDISTDSWLSKLLKKKIPYSAKIIKVISYNALDNKRKNPTVTVCLKIDAAWGEIKQKMGWSFIPDGIYGDGKPYANAFFMNAPDLSGGGSPSFEDTADIPDGVFDATETMRRNLEAAGRDASDEALANMSVDEAYAAFFGNFDDAKEDERRSTEKAQREAKERERQEAEARRKAEEQKRKEAEAQAAEAKKKQEEAEKKAYEKALREWNQAVEKVKASRQTEVDRRKSIRKAEMTAEEDRKLAAAKTEAEKAIAAAERKKKTALETLSGLGAFKLGEKKAQKALIAEAEAEISVATRALIEAESTYQAATASIEKSLDQYADTQMKDVEKRFPLPKQPEKPAVVKEEERMAEKARQAAEAEVRKKAALEKKNAELQETILKVMLIGKWYRLSEIKYIVPALEYDEGTAHVEELCLGLERKGKLMKVVEKGVVYFAIAE